jgi:hypothetical protein
MSLECNLFVRSGERNALIQTPSEAGQGILWIKPVGALLSLLLGNLGHLIHHEYRLFVSLKLAGVAVNSEDIYTWHGAPEG